MEARKARLLIKNKLTVIKNAFMFRGEGGIFNILPVEAQKKKLDLAFNISKNMAFINGKHVTNFKVRLTV